MIRAIVWKELREQGLIALSLVVLGSGVLVAAALLADPPVESASPADVIRYLGTGRLATLMLVVTAGMVCGGAVFAAEREAGTMAFLDSLPASRWQLWRAKLIAGLGLAAMQIGLLVVVASGLGFVPTLGWAVAVALYALLAFAWGLFGSTTATHHAWVGRPGDPRCHSGQCCSAAPGRDLLPEPRNESSPSERSDPVSGGDVRTANRDVGMAVHPPGSGPGSGGTFPPQSWAAGPDRTLLAGRPAVAHSRAGDLGLRPAFRSHPPGPGCSAGAGLAGVGPDGGSAGRSDGLCQ